MRISDWSSDVCSSDLTLQILSAQGLPTPKTILCKFPVDVELIGRELGFPVVVKTLIGTRGTGVLLCMDRDQFADLANLLDNAQSGTNFLFQQYIQESHGREIGRASGRERECQYVKISVGVVSFKKKKQMQTQ